MSYLVLVVLSLLWLGFFLPSLLQSRRTSSPLGSAETFRESLTRISTGAAVTPESVAARAARRPPRRSRATIARQRDVLTALGAGVLGSVVLTVAFGGAARWLIVLSVLSLVSYAALLRLRVVQSMTRRGSVTPLAPRPSRAVPEDAGDADQVVPSVARREADAQQELERVAG